jgi:molybdenum-dependent DNA-binding transcriptional regulator ModE
MESGLIKNMNRIICHNLIQQRRGLRRGTTSVGAFVTLFSEIMGKPLQ